MAVAEVFSALGDTVRLEMVQRLTQGQPSTISDVSSGLGITRQGARKHLQVLADAGIVTLEPQGREVAVELDIKKLDSARAYITELEKQWDARLDALKRYVESGKA